MAKKKPTTDNISHIHRGGGMDRAFRTLGIMFVVAIGIAIMAPAVVQSLETISDRKDIAPSMQVQPSGSNTISWTGGKWLTQTRDGATRPARGIEVKSTSSGGVLKVWMVNDLNAANTRQYLSYPIAASDGQTQRIGLIFGEVVEVGTTIDPTDIIVWF